MIWLVEALFCLAGISGGDLIGLFRCWREVELSLRYQWKWGAVLRLKGELFVQLVMMMSSVVTHCCLFCLAAKAAFIVCCHVAEDLQGHTVVFVIHCHFADLQGCIRLKTGQRLKFQDLEWQVQVAQVPRVRKGVWCPWELNGGYHAKTRQRSDSGIRSSWISYQVVRKGFIHPHRASKTGTRCSWWLIEPKMGQEKCLQGKWSYMYERVGMMKI